MLQANYERAGRLPSLEQRARERLRRFKQRFGQLSAAQFLALDSELIQRYSEPHRRYHTLDHIDYCLGQLDLANHLMNDPDAVEIALWFHDVIYVPDAKDNELKSAEFFMEQLGWYTDPAFSQSVYQMILFTTHRETPTRLDEQFVVDIDLSSFGMPWALFIQNSQRVRDESPHLSDDAFYSAHRVFLQSLLDRPTFFFTEFFQTLYETAARENICRSLEELRLQRDPGQR